MDKDFIIINNKVFHSGYTIKMDSLSFILQDWYFRIENSEKKLMDMMECVTLIPSKHKPQGRWTKTVL